eukprot:12895717-Prorocentrum_lima.AAC.1
MSVLLRGSQLVKRLSKPVVAGAADAWYFAMGGFLGFSMLVVASHPALPPWVPCCCLLHPCCAGQALLLSGGGCEAVSYTHLTLPTICSV